MIILAILVILFYLAGFWIFVVRPTYFKALNEAEIWEDSNRANYYFQVLIEACPAFLGCFLKYNFSVLLIGAVGYGLWLLLTSISAETIIIILLIVLIIIVLIK